MYTFVSGRLRCVRCGVEEDVPIQTRLFYTTRDTANQVYAAGDSVVIDGLDGDYYPLIAWNGTEPLQIAMGDWDCGQCGLNWQWARAVFAAHRTTGGLSATIVRVEPLIPLTAAALDGLHFVQPDLAKLSWFPETAPSEAECLEAWARLSVVERSERVASGFRAWCQKVAGIRLRARD